MTTQLSLLDTPTPPVIDAERTGLCRGFTRRYKGQPAIEVIAFGIERFTEVFGAAPTAVITSYADAQDLEGKTALQIDTPGCIGVGNFYLKRDEAA